MLLQESSFRRGLKLTSKFLWAGLRKQPLEILQDTVVGALDECKCILVSTSWAGSFYGKGLQTVGIQCLGAYATMRLSYKNYNTAIKCQLSQAAPIANSSWAA